MMFTLLKVMTLKPMKRVSVLRMVMFWQMIAAREITVQHNILKQPKKWLNYSQTFRAL